MKNSFAHFGLPDAIVNALADMSITEPFPVQNATIPDALAGRDVSGRAPTGSGKTLAFGLPLLVKAGRAGKFRPTALVLAPTRELAEQIKRDLAPLAAAVGRRVIAVYGGVGYGPQKQGLRRGADVLVATPGRLEDLIEQRSVDLGDVAFVVVDEADRMADMGFLPAVRRLLDQTSTDRQTLLFSATLDGAVAVLSRDYQRDPVRHETGTVESDTVDAEHHFWLVPAAERIRRTAEIVEFKGRSIVFTRTRHGADRLAKQLGQEGVKAVAMHGGRSQRQRTRALEAFSAGTAHALIATDVAARGIHVDDVASVVHFDLPADSKDYVHRSGRTGRAGATGTVVALVTHEKKRDAGRLQRELGLELSVAHPEIGVLGTGGARLPDQSRVNADTPDSRPRGRRDPQQRADRDSSQKPRGRDGGARPRTSPSNGATKSIYVANLPWSATDRDVSSLFGKYGSVKSATVITDRRSGRSKGFGFVDMTSSDAARVAVKELHGSRLAGRDLTVRFAQPRKFGS